MESALLAERPKRSSVQCTSHGACGLGKKAGLPSTCAKALKRRCARQRSRAHALASFGCVLQSILGCSRCSSSYSHRRRRCSCCCKGSHLASGQCATSWPDPTPIILRCQPLNHCGCRAPGWRLGWPASAPQARPNGLRTQEAPGPRQQPLENARPSRWLARGWRRARRS